MALRLRVNKFDDNTYYCVFMIYLGQFIPCLKKLLVETHEQISLKSACYRRFA